MSHLPVTGCQTGRTVGTNAWDLPQRLEWQDFKKSQIFTLFVTALQRFMDQDDSDNRSYFRIAGIHGWPRDPWDSDYKPSDGYCAHNTMTFPTWHRPYLALFEQTLASYFPEVIGDVGQNDPALAQTLEEASKTWRLPYWDWCLYPQIPEEFSQPEIDIYSPNGGTDSAPNPLQQYKFKTKPTYEPYSNWETTLRQPSSDDSDAISQTEKANANLAGDQAHLKTLVMELFPQPLDPITPWFHFSNDQWELRVNPQQGNLTSLENIHNLIHGNVGGKGHFGQTWFAAFDPIFWVHHCQVDRLFAVWEAAYPKIFFNDTGLNTKITKDTDLSPFWDSQSSLVTSANCQLTNKYNYTYPEFAKPNGLSSDEAYQKIAELYGGEHRPTFLLAEAKRAATETKIATLPTPTPKKQSIFDRFHLHIPGFKRKKPKSSAPQKLPAAPATSVQQVGRDQEPTVGTYQDWVVNITLEKFALQGMGYVIVFLGPEQEIPSNESEWQTCPIYVGSVNVFASNPDHSECQSCKRQKESGLRVGGSVYLTNTLIDKHVPLIGQAPVDYLKANLHWRLKDDSDREKIREDVPSLKVLVSSVGYEIGADGKLARKNWVRQVEITRDKAGGVKNADDF